MEERIAVDKALIMAVTQDAIKRIDAAETAIIALLEATRIVKALIEICDKEQLSQIDGVRHWLEVYSIEEEQGDDHGESQKMCALQSNI